MAPSFDAVTRAALRLSGAAHRTPVLTSRTLDELVGAQVFLKAENFQRAGSFKFRGAYNALSALSPDQRLSGAVTYSSGNHAQAIALAGKLLEVPTTVIMPADSPKVKMAATAGYGARIVTYDRENESREAVAAGIQRETGAALIPPFDHEDVIAGQGTAALELIEDVGFLDALFVCVGGGGLISGCALAAKSLSPRCDVIGVEPQAGDDATRSFQTRTLQSVHNPQTIADGARTASLGTLTFPLILELVSDMLTVTDDELLEAQRFCLSRIKVVVEPTGVLGLAGLLRHRERFKKQRVGVILSGGNTDLGGLLA
jgi:threonine dehydratase